MKLYIQNICWDCDDLNFDEDKIKKLPTKLEVNVNIEEEQIESTDEFNDNVDILMFLEEEYGCTVLEYDWSILGFDLDVREKIGDDYYSREIFNEWCGPLQ